MGSQPSFMDYVGETIFVVITKVHFVQLTGNHKWGKGGPRVIKSHLHFSFNFVGGRSQYIEVVNFSPVLLEMVKTHKCRHTGVSIYHYASSAGFVV